MPQFDIHRNPGRGKADIPYVVVVQSAYYDRQRTRLVAPLVINDGAVEWRYPGRMPHFIVEGRRVVLDPLLMQAVPSTSLGPVVASLADDNSAVAIITAIDEVISRSYG
jgi:toxin CcdB